MGYERFYHIFKIFRVLNPFMPWSEYGSVSFLPGFGSVTNFFTSWIRIRTKMIRIRHTARNHPLHVLTWEVLGGRLACRVLRASTHWDLSYSEDRKKEYVRPVLEAT